MSNDSVVRAKNLQLYVARVEENSPKKWLAQIFSTVGKVSNIDFIPRKDYNGRDYKSAIISFKHWVQTDDSTKLFNDMNESVGGTTKFYYVDKRGQVKYLHVKEQPQENVQLQSELIHNVAELKEAADNSNSYACQIIYYQIRNRELEKQAVELNSTQLIQRLQHDYMVHKLEEAERANEEFRLREIELKKEIELLRRDVSDRNRIIDYYEEEDSSV
jgi:hypothetical protein